MLRDSENRDDDVAPNGIEKKALSILGFFQEYDSINVSGHSIEFQSAEDTYCEWQLQVEFTSSLDMKNHWENSSSVSSEIPLISENLLVQFEGKDDLFHQISALLCQPESSEIIEFNIYNNTTEVDMDFEMSYKCMENITFS